MPYLASPFVTLCGAWDAVCVHDGSGIIAIPEGTEERHVLAFGPTSWGRVTPEGWTWESAPADAWDDLTRARADGALISYTEIRLDDGHLTRFDGFDAVEQVEERCRNIIAKNYQPANAAIGTRGQQSEAQKLPRIDRAAVYKGLAHSDLILILVGNSYDQFFEVIRAIRALSVEVIRATFTSFGFLLQNYAHLDRLSDIAHEGKTSVLPVLRCWTETGREDEAVRLAFDASVEAASGGKAGPEIEIVTGGADVSIRLRAVEEGLSAKSVFEWYSHVFRALLPDRNDASTSPVRNIHTSWHHVETAAYPRSAPSATPSSLSPKSPARPSSTNTHTTGRIVGDAILLVWQYAQSTHYRRYLPDLVSFFRALAEAIDATKDGQTNDVIIQPLTRRATFVFLARIAGAAPGDEPVAEIGRGTATHKVTMAAARLARDLVKTLRHPEANSAGAMEILVGLTSIRSGRSTTYYRRGEDLPTFSIIEVPAQKFLEEGHKWLFLVVAHEAGHRVRLHGHEIVSFREMLFEILSDNFERCVTDLAPGWEETTATVCSEIKSTLVPTANSIDVRRSLMLFADQGFILQKRFLQRGVLDASDLSTAHEVAAWMGRVTSRLEDLSRELRADLCAAAFCGAEASLEYLKSRPDTRRFTIVSSVTGRDRSPDSFGAMKPLVDWLLKYWATLQQRVYGADTTVEVGIPSTEQDLVKRCFNATATLAKTLHPDDLHEGST